MGFSQHGVEALAAITKGDLVMLNTDGFAEAAAAQAANKGCVGIATETVTGGAANGDVSIKVEEGIFSFEGQSGFTAADVMTAAFASAAGTISGTQGANEPKAGTVVKFRSASSVDVYVGIDAVLDSSA